MTSPTVYLISGATRGIGLGFVTHILETHENAFVYAGARDPENAPALKALKERYPEKLSIVKCVSADVAGNAAIGQEIEAKHGRVDTVIANAGVGRFNVGNVDAVSVADMNKHFEVNVMGAIILFQSVYSLLKKSANPRFVSMSTIGGSLTTGLIDQPIQGVAYGSTKAALNFITRKIHFENDWIVAFPLSPGGVQTDMLHTGFVDDSTGFFEGMVGDHSLPVPEAAVMLINIIDNSTREGEGGQYVHIDGSRHPW